MSNSEESRDSLDLLASAAEQSSPHSRIKRNTACISCRDSKVKCNASSVPGQPCLRCGKLKLQCVVDKSHKRVSKRSKLEELVQEVQSIKDAVGAKASPSVPQFPLPPIQTTALPSPDQPQYLPTGAAPLSSASFSAPPPPAPRPVASFQDPVLTPMHTSTPASSTGGRAVATEARALKSRVFSGQDIDFYFDKYFEDFHPYLPIVRIKEPDAVYKSGPILFWIIIVTACRRYARGDEVYPFLIDAVKTEVWDSVSDPPLSLATINALLVLCAWPLPTIRFIKDPSAIYSSLLMNSCYLLGIHTGRGDYPARTFPMYPLSVSDEEAVYTWAGYNIITQRVSTYGGTPSTGQLFNRTIENILDGTCPTQVPLHFRILLEGARFLNRVSRTMAANLEGVQGVSHRVVELLEEDFDKVQRLMSLGISEIDYFTILSTLLEVQVFYFIPLPGFSQETFKRNVFRCYTTAQHLISQALKLNRELAFLSHAPHFVFRSILTAVCVQMSVLSARDVVVPQDVDALVQDALTAMRACSIQKDDLPIRASKIMENWWSARHLLGPTEISQLGARDFSHRLGMSLPLDCIRRWKRQIESIRPPAQQSTPFPGADNSRPPDVAPVDPPSIDWDAFMEDFDWNFDPNLLSTVVTV